MWLMALGVGAGGGPRGSWALVWGLEGAQVSHGPWWGQPGLSPVAPPRTEVDTGKKAPCANAGYEASLQPWVLSWLHRQSTNETQYLT